MLLIKIPFSITTKDMLNAEKIVKLYWNASKKT